MKFISIPQPKEDIELHQRSYTNNLNGVWCGSQEFLRPVKGPRVPAFGIDSGWCETRGLVETSHSQCSQ
jgi:hypothetical protein